MTPAYMIYGMLLLLWQSKQAASDGILTMSSAEPTPDECHPTMAMHVALLSQLVGY